MTRSFHAFSQDRSYGGGRGPGNEGLWDDGRQRSHADTRLGTDTPWRLRRHSVTAQEVEVGNGKTRREQTSQGFTDVSYDTKLSRPSGIFIDNTTSSLFFNKWRHPPTPPNHQVPIQCLEPSVSLLVFSWKAGCRYSLLC